MEKVYRLDKGLVTSLDKGDGFLRCKVSFARDGVFPYLYPNGKTYMEAKPADEIYSDLQ